VAFEAIAAYSNGTTQNVSDAGTTFWSNSNPSVLQPAPTISPSPGEYSGLCPGASVVAASLNSGLHSQQVTVSVTGAAPSACLASPSSSPTTAVQLAQQQTAIQTLPTLQWSFDAQAPIGPVMIAAPSGTVYFTSADNVLHALSASGQELWSTSVGGPALLLGQHQDLYVIDQQGLVKALDPNGLTLWQADIGGGMAALALGPQGTLYAAGSAGLVSFNADGAVNWSLPGVSGSALAVSTAGEIFLATAGATIMVVAPDGRQLSSITPAGGFAGALAADGSGNVYAGSAEGVIYALGSGGGVAWQFRASGPIVAGPVIGADGTIDFVADGLYALTQSGQLAWHSATEPDSDDIILTPTSSALLMAEPGGISLVLKPDGTASAALKINGAVSALAGSTDGQIYIGSQNGYVYAVK
jgi:hypothetical protein